MATSIKITASECFESYMEIRKIEGAPLMQKGATIEIVEQILNDKGIILTRQPPKKLQVCIDFFTSR